VTAETTEIKLPSRLDAIEKAAAEAEKFAKSAGFSEQELYPIDMAVREAVANAVKHGNLLDETKDVEIALSSSGKDFEITVRDFGTGFAVEEIPDPTNPENLLKASGRGILFIRTFMDEVEWFHHPAGGTVIKMTKKR
jgi:serine/threonine-protein kinase RsbW